MTHSTCQHKAYGLACSTYEALMARASGECEMCGIAATETGPQALRIDHDHAIGMNGVRGLVCARCNTLLGLMDGGRRPYTAEAREYVEHAWHLHNAPDESWRERRQALLKARAEAQTAAAARAREAAEAEERRAGERKKKLKPIVAACRRARRSEEEATVLRTARNELIRHAVAVGAMTAADLYNTTSLSKTQVERIIRGNSSGVREAQAATPDA